MRRKADQEAEKKRERDEKRDKEKADRKAEAERKKEETTEKMKNIREATKKIQLIQPLLSKLEALLDHPKTGNVPKAIVTASKNKKCQKELGDIKKACERCITGTAPSTADKDKMDSTESALNEAKTSLSALQDFIQAAERHS